MTEYEVIDFGDACAFLSVGADSAGRMGKREREGIMTLALVRKRFGKDAGIGHDADGAPFVTTLPKIHISLSHSGNRAAIAVSAEVPVGIDLQESSPRLRRVRERFLTPEQLLLWGDDDEALLRLWTIKEAVYKAAGIKELTSGRIAVSADMTRAEVEHNGSVMRYILEYPEQGLSLCALESVSGQDKKQWKG